MSALPSVSRAAAVSLVNAPAATNSAPLSCAALAKLSSVSLSEHAESSLPLMRASIMCTYSTPRLATSATR